MGVLHAVRSVWSWGGVCERWPWCRRLLIGRDETRTGVFSSSCRPSQQVETALVGTLSGFAR